MIPSLSWNTLYGHEPMSMEEYMNASKCWKFLSYHLVYSSIFLRLRCWCFVDVHRRLRVNTFDSAVDFSVECNSNGIFIPFRFLGIFMVPLVANTIALPAIHSITIFFYHNVTTQKWFCFHRTFPLRIVRRLRLWFSFPPINYKIIDFLSFSSFSFRRHKQLIEVL